MSAPPEPRFAEQRALVTGAGSGIGRAVARRLAEEGARLFLVGRTAGKIDAVAGELGPERATSATADVSVDGEVEELLVRIEREMGGLEILVHSAGLFETGTVADGPVEHLDRQFLTHLRAPWLVTQKALPMLREGGGQIVFLNSTAIWSSRPGTGAYTATKAGLRAFADCLRAEENERGVRVLSVYPGRTATPMQEEVFALEGREWSPERLLQPEDVARAVADALAQPRTAEVTDLRIRPFRKL